MTKLQELIKEMTFANERMMGDVWHNEIIKEVFSEVKSNKFNCDIAQFILSLIKNNNKLEWYHLRFTKTQLRKLHSIMVAKTKATQQKRVLAFSDLIASGCYASLLNKTMINAWVKFCNEHKLEHGLVKANRVKNYQNMVDKMFS